MATAQECNSVRHDLKQLRSGRKKIKTLTALIMDRQRLFNDAGAALNRQFTNTYRDLSRECERIMLLYKRYDKAIAMLPATDADIIVQCYIYGKNCATIGSDIGYCRESIQRHLNIAVSRIADILYEVK